MTTPSSDGGPEPLSSDGTFESFRRAEMLLEQRRPLDAIQALQPVLDRQPDSASVHLLAARAYLHSAQLRRAEGAFSRVIEIDPSDHYARFGLGLALSRMGEFEAAVEQLALAAAMRPENRDYASALRHARATLDSRR